MQLRRNRSTRSLWDPSYVDETWINDRVQLMPRLKSWVNTYYPGTPIGITEYNWGAENHINGATTQADIYGIFGREGLDMGARWATPASSTPTYKAMKMYRNYDGNRSTFGDVERGGERAESRQRRGLCRRALGRWRADRHGDQQILVGDDPGDDQPREREPSRDSASLAADVGKRHYAPPRPHVQRQQYRRHSAGAEHHALRRARQRDGHAAASANQPQDCAGRSNASRRGSCTVGFERSGADVWLRRNSAITTIPTPSMIATSATLKIPVRNGP